MLLDLALTSGRPPRGLLGEDLSDVWELIDLDILAEWKAIKNNTCPGCGRPVSQHVYNTDLHREETVEDYVAWSMDCPAIQAVAVGQSMWRTANKSEMDAYNKGNGSDPTMGVYWMAQGSGESRPIPEPPTDSDN